MSDLGDIAQRLVAWAHDGEEVEAYVSRSVEFEAVAYNADIESISRAESLGVGVRVIRDHRVGFAYATTFDDETLRATLHEACDNAAFASYDECAGLARPDGVAAQPLDLWDSSLLSFDTDAKVALALDLERQTLSADSRIRSVRSAEYGDGYSEVAIVSSTGINAESRSTGCYISVQALAGDDFETQTGGGYCVRRSPALLELDEAVERAVLLSTRMLGATKPKSTRLPVVFDNHVSPTILGALSAALNGENVAKGRSLFADRMNSRVAVPGFTLVDDPTDARAYFACSYDGEGLASRRNVLIDDGVLRGFLYDTYAAARAGSIANGAAVRGGFRGGPSTGARALVLQPGEKTAEELVADLEIGVYVQSVMGAGTGGINQISGDVSLGAEGLLIVDGEFGEPVREFTIASTIQEMLMNIAGIGAESVWLPGSIAGSTLVINDMALSGT